MPQFTSLFWKGDSRVKGNPNLLPEKSTSLNGKMDLNLQKLNISLTGFYNNIKNLIYWKQSALGIWQPDNFLHAQISGIKTSISYEPIDALGFEINGSKIYPSNKSKESDHYNKYLLNKHLYKLNSKLTFNYNEFSLKFTNTRVGKQFASFDNNVEIPGYSTWGIKIHGSKFIGTINSHFILSMNNIFDQRYETYRHIPAPGRNFSLKLTINLN